MTDLFQERRRFFSETKTILNGANWNPALHPRDTNGEFRYNGGRHRRVAPRSDVTKWDYLIPPHPANSNVFENMVYMHLLAHEIGLYPATLRFFFLVETDGLWDYKNQPSHGANPDHDSFGNFNYGAAGTALGLSPHMLEAMGGLFNKEGGKGKPISLFDWAGVSPYGDRPLDNYWIKKGIEYAHLQGY